MNRGGGGEALVAARGTQGCRRGTILLCALGLRFLNLVSAGVAWLLLDGSRPSCGFLWISHSCLNLVISVSIYGAVSVWVCFTNVFLCYS